MDNADLEKTLADYILNYSWTEPSLLKDPKPMVLWVLKFPNNYGMIIRKDNDPKSKFCEGLIDTLGFSNEYYFERPKKHKLTERKFESIQELIACIQMVKGYEDYEPER